MRKLFIVPLLLAPLSAGCVALGLGAAAGVLVSQDLLDNDSYVAHVQRPVDRTWLETKSTLASSSLEPLDVDEDLKRAKAKIDGATVSVRVESYDLERSVLRIEAKKYGVNNGEIAKKTLDKIVKNLE